jgi:hypothetical protein
MESKSKEIYMYILGALIVLGIFSIIGLLLFNPMPEVNEQLLTLLLGVFAAKFADVVGYFFGSSKSSADKTALLSKETPKE